MFRKPRSTNTDEALIKPSTPSVGRPPTPPHSPLANHTSQSITTETPLAHMTSVTARPPSAHSISTPGKPSGTSTLSRAPSSGRANKIKSAGNASILNFFKKVDTDKDPESLFLAENIGRNGLPRAGLVALPAPSLPTEVDALSFEQLDNNDRYNEFETPSKRRRLSSPIEDPTISEKEAPNDGLTQPLAEYTNSRTPPISNDDEKHCSAEPGSEHPSRPTSTNGVRPRGPFLDDSDSDNETPFPQRQRNIVVKDPIPMNVTALSTGAETSELPIKVEETEEDALANDAMPQDSVPPQLKREATSYAEADGFADFEGMEDFEDEFADGDEVAARRWMMQRRADMEEGDVEGEFEADEFGFEDELPDDQTDIKEERQEEEVSIDTTAPTCPMCGGSFAGVSDQEASVHVNHCLDGNPTPLPTPKIADEKDVKVKEEAKPAASKFRRPVRPAKPGQESPFMLGKPNGTSSAFSMLMSGHAEDAAWANAAAAEHAARGKPAFQRTCPFYKILPGLHICVDAFRYGAVEGCNAYFLSHFHSDHYIGLTSTWCHGPIYCSRVTANLVKQQLRVDPKWVVPLEFDQRVEVPGTEGVDVTMIPANHCPGSSLYLFEKVIGKGKNPKVQRILHCGDFRACPAHVEHPLLRPDVMDVVTGKTAQQKIDVCYLDTTYLNPKYAFPSQEDVIQACADMCVSLNKQKVDKSDEYEQMKAERAGGAMAKFVRTNSKDDNDGTNPENPESTNTSTTTTKPKSKDSTRGKLLVVVGTYSIGKERICIGIARALGSKIYAPPGKQRICAALEDAELNAILTTNPREAQVHMTPLFEIRAETLGDYLADFADTFTRCVGFRPSGWNYRPPGSRFVESPAVSTVLSSDNWKSVYSMRELVPQRGSTLRAACYGVPYSEHSSFRELTMFCCALRIEKIVPTVNVGSKVGRDRMKVWCERWAVERKRNGLWKGEWYPGRGTVGLRTTL